MNKAAPAEALRQGLIQTEITPGVAWGMIACFVLLIASVPALQLAIELSRPGHPQLLDLFARAPAKSHLRAWEENLERTSVVRNFFQPLLQELITEHGGFGNTNAVLGRDGWLFFRPGVEYVGGRGFLEQVQLDERRRRMFDEGERNPQPDPRGAILQFHRQCADLGIHLIVVPIPEKTMLQSSQLTGRYSATGSLAPPNNPSFPQWIRELRARGVDVFDPTPTTIEASEQRYLVQDTHWTPGWMQSIAGELAASIQRKALVSHRRTQALRVEEQPVSRLGDLVEMLKLRGGQQVFTPQRVTIQRVVQAANAADWQPEKVAEVLLLGDSFANIYSLDQMGWGTSAGFAEHLSFALQRPVDRISRNDDGAFAARQMLSGELAKGRNRLAGKKVVIWEFAMRELATGDWKLLEMQPRDPTPGRFIVPSPGTTRTVRT